ncbi:MAG TPA: HDOD domain-containing protein [Burkholderiales bacterium]|nr:HDOD domain-containing protein [Burkholderiales bacterium]
MSELRTPQSWISRFGQSELPVLAQTIAALDAVRQDIDNVSMPRLADAVMHDPLMTFKVLRYIQQRRSRRQTGDVTTISHSLMMLGIEPFMAHFADQEPLESRLAANPMALKGARSVISRARHAALYARDWAVLRHDIEIDEVTTAALLHDFAELLLWCFAPTTAVEMEDTRRLFQKRSEAVQRETLGFPMIALQLELAHAWQLPDLICQLMDERHALTPRALNVSLAVALARHSAHGWDDAALPDDFAAIGRLIGLSPDGARERILKIAAKAAPACEAYGIPPAITGLVV